MANTICGQPTAEGHACRNPVMHGADRCVSHLGRAPRNTKLTPEVAERLEGLLRAGNYDAVALRAAGVPRRTFTYWMAKGRTGRPADARYAELRQRLERARAEGEAALVDVIREAARTNWVAAAWLLERRNPAQWGRVSVRLRSEPASPAEPEPVPEPDDPFREVDELAARRRQR